MKKVQITVLKRTWNGDLAEKYAAPDLGPCEYHHEGETFYSNGWQKPEGLCDNAWKCMQEYVIALAHGAENFYDGELLDKKAFVASCNDGFRPVSFLVRATDDEADLFVDKDDLTH